MTRGRRDRTPRRLRALFGCAFLALAAFGCIGDACEYDPKDEVTRGDRKVLDFYYQCLSAKCPLDGGRELPPNPDEPIGSLHVVFVEARGGGGDPMPAYRFESDDPEVFEIREVGCDGTCTLFGCEYELECAAPYVYHVSLRPLRAGSAKLLVYDEHDTLVDSATVTIRPASDAGT